MIKFTEEQIQAKFQQLPKEIQEAVTSSDVHDKIIEISKKHSLHVDQEGVLVDQIGLIMLGLSSSKDFVKNFSSEAEIDTKTATAIAEDINKEVFDTIRTSMREIEARSDIERAGDFSIENEQGNKNNDNDSYQHVESHEDVIKAIENPSSVSNNTENILIDHFLSGPVASIEKKTEIDNDPVPQKPKPPKGPDQYREPIA